MKRRAQSYSDFHYAVTAVLGGGAISRTRSIGVGKRTNKADCKPQESEIQNEIDFANWYDQWEDELLDSSHDEYTAYQKQLELSQSHLDSLLSDTSSTINLLASLKTSFKEVESHTTTFQGQCEGILKEQKRIESLADSLEHNLKFYQFLEPVTRRLNAPGAGNFVKSKEFSDMLARLDDCLEYMAAHVSPFVMNQSKRLTTLATSPRSSYLQVALSLAVDQRSYFDTCTLCWGITRDSIRCVKTHC